MQKGTAGVLLLLACTDFGDPFCVALSIVHYTHSSAAQCRRKSVAGAPLTVLDGNIEATPKIYIQLLTTLALIRCYIRAFTISLSEKDILIKWPFSQYAPVIRN